MRTDTRIQLDMKHDEVSECKTRALFRLMNDGHRTPWIITPNISNMRLSLDILDALLEANEDIQLNENGIWYCFWLDEHDDMNSKILREMLSKHFVFIAEIDGVIRVGVDLRFEFLDAVIETWTQYCALWPNNTEIDEHPNRI
jgi:hypothetical protein